jgi:hypothetical protein
LNIKRRIGFNWHAADIIELLGNINTVTDSGSFDVEKTSIA